MSDHPDTPTSERWARIASLFDEASQRPATEWDAFFRSRCPDDPDLEAEVRGLLAADAAYGILEAPVDALAAQLIDVDESTSRADEDLTEAFGAYRLIRELGHGGMGRVYLAERADGAYRQRVALKLVRREAAHPQLRERFLFERQILARLQHPNIARLLDGGVTDEGAPYLVMEHVEGRPITEWADARKLSVAARLELFLSVADAVYYASRNLTVHRDLKPANILVTEEGSVRLLDFGIAKLLEDVDEGGAGPETMPGALMLTPEYAAPEQIVGGTISFATDVYSLGAVLYEVLAGRVPVEVTRRSLDDIARAAKTDVTAPSRSVDSATPERAFRVAELRGTSVRSLVKALRGDLDAILLKALRKDPERRYLNAGEMAADIRRFLRGYPVRAGPETFIYRASKYMRRHAVLAGAGVALAASLVAGVIGTVYQARAATAEAQRVQAISAFVTGLFEGADPADHRGVMPSARDLVDRGLATIDSLPSDDPVRLDLLATLASLYYRLGEYGSTVNLHRRVLDETTSLFPGDDARIGTALAQLGTVLSERVELAEARTVLEESIVRLRRAGAADTTVAFPMNELVSVLNREGRTDEAVALGREVVAVETRARGVDHPATLTARHNLASALINADELEEAEGIAQGVLEARRRLRGETDPDAIIDLGTLGVISGRKGDWEAAARYHEEALSLRRQIYPDGHPDVARSLDQLGLALTSMGRLRDADRTLGEALVLRREQLGSDHPDVANTLTNIAVLRYRLGAFAAAAAAQEEAVAIWRVELGIENPLVATGINNLGAMYREAGDLARAEPLLLEGLELRTRTYGARHSTVGQSLRNVGALRRLQGRMAEAERALREALEIYAATLDADHVRVVEAELDLAAVLTETDRVREAAPLVEHALGLRRAAMEVGDLQLAEAEAWGAIVRLRLDGPDGAARGVLERSRDQLRAAYGDDHHLVARATQELARSAAGS